MRVTKVLSQKAFLTVGGIAVSTDCMHHGNRDNFAQQIYCTMNVAGVTEAFTSATCSASRPETAFSFAAASKGATTLGCATMYATTTDFSSST